MYEVHQSEVKAFRQCQKRHWYQYRERIQAVRKPRPLLRGTIVHQMIESKINGDDPWAPLKEAKKKHRNLIELDPEYSDLVDEITAMMKGYFSFYENDDLKYLKIKGHRSEIPFSVKLMRGVKFGGKIDAFPKTPDGRRWVMDHKTHKSIPTGDAPYTDLQTIMYAWALRQSGRSVDGVLWDYLRVKVPSIPKTLKNGTLSKAKIDTTWTIYKQAVIDNGEDPADYDDMKEQLEGKEGDFYSRVYLPVNDDLMENFVKELKWTTQQILDCTKPVRTLSNHCDWCQFKTLCRAELFNLDTDWIREKEYEEKE